MLPPRSCEGREDPKIPPASGAPRLGRYLPNALDPPSCAGRLLLNNPPASAGFPAALAVPNALLPAVAGGRLPNADDACGASALRLEKAGESPAGGRRLLPNADREASVSCRFEPPNADFGASSADRFDPPNADDVSNCLPPAGFAALGPTVRVWNAAGASCRPAGRLPLSAHAERSDVPLPPNLLPPDGRGDDPNALFDSGAAPSRGPPLPLLLPPKADCPPERFGNLPSPEAPAGAPRDLRHAANA